MAVFLAKLVSSCLLSAEFQLQLLPMGDHRHLWQVLKHLTQLPCLLTLYRPILETVSIGSIIEWK